MRPKIFIILLAALALISALFFWKSIQSAGRKAAPIKKSQVTRPAKAQRAQGPRIAIVMDDFGYNMNNLDNLFNIGEPVTLSILPDLAYSRRIAESASAHGYETILHLPLESHNKGVREEVDTIRSGMTKEEVLARLQKEIGSVSGCSGVSNHMGSKSTEDTALMTLIFGYLKRDNLYFFDSLTSQKSVCRNVAAATGLRYARRDVFLDNSNNSDYIKKQLQETKRIAVKRGRAIAVCHDRKNTVAVLAEVAPEMKREGIRFVKLSELVK